MKKIIILMVMWFTMACITQKQIVINGKKNFIIPKESEQITPDQVASKFPDLEDKFIANTEDSFFVIDGMLVGLSIKPPSPDIEYTKPSVYYINQAESVMKISDYKVNDITIKIYNNQSYFVFDYENGIDKYLQFKSFQKGTYNAYRGIIRYTKSTSKDQAYRVLDGVLNNVKITSK